MKQVYAAFFRGQFGFISSPGMDQMAYQARANGIAADVFSGTGDLITAYTKARAQLMAGVAVALIGYSEGVGDVGWIEERLPDVDLCCAIDPSRDCYNYVLKKPKRGILFHDNFFLEHITGIGGAGESSDPGGDLGYQTKLEFEEDHLYMDLDPRIHARVLQELLRLKQEQ